MLPWLRFRRQRGEAQRRKQSCVTATKKDGVINQVLFHPHCLLLVCLKIKSIIWELIAGCFVSPSPCICRWLYPLCIFPLDREDLLLLASLHKSHLPHTSLWLSTLLWTSQNLLLFWQSLSSSVNLAVFLTFLSQNLLQPLCYVAFFRFQHHNCFIFLWCIWVPCDIPRHASKATMVGLCSEIIHFPGSNRSSRQVRQ